MTGFERVRKQIRSAFSGQIANSNELNRAIDEKVKAGNCLLVAGVTISSALQGKDDVREAVIEATRMAGEFH